MKKHVTFGTFAMFKGTLFIEIDLEGHLSGGKTRVQIKKLC